MRTIHTAILWTLIGSAGLSIPMVLPTLSVQAQDIQNSEEAQARMQKGISLYQQSQYAAALTELQFVAERYPNYGAAYRLAGLCQLQLQQYEPAVVSLKRANELSMEQEKREDSAARIALSRALFYAGKFEEAIPELTYAVSQKPNDATSHYLLGATHFQLKHEPEALASLSQAVTLNPKDLASWKLLTGIQLQRLAANPEDKTQLTKTQSTLQSLKSLDASAESAGLAGQFYLLTRQFAKAAPELEKAATASPDNGLIQFNLGIALSRSDQFAKAAPVLIRASELLPENTNVLKELGYVYEKDGKAEKARAVYEKGDQLANGQDEYFKTALERVK